MDTKQEGPNRAVLLAARWYAEHRADCPHPVIPHLKRMFGLSGAEAVNAIREANGQAQ